LQKYLSENISLFKEIEFHRKIYKTILTQAILVALINIGPLFLCKFYSITLALGDITRLTFKRIVTPGTFFGFMHMNKDALMINAPKVFKLSER